ncbi:putative dehydrogenase [Stakelama sediminis]|uniref:Putative dehydrogenase n=1 Tax=Stakelama sediminis TaxID=463200 RepID=A0A840Z1C6_9SPHN|nr:putative dehydrogenase [Stakelama sediminis]
MTDRTIRVALFGYGTAGKVFHAPLIGAVPGFDLACVVTSRADEVAQDWPSVRVAATVEEALDDPTIDLAVVATPDHLHADHARLAIAAGKHVVVDKPFALTMDDARDVVERAERAGVKLSVFQNRRWDSDFLTLRKLIGQGDLGTITHFESHFDRFRPELRHRWKEGPGAGIWPGLGPHLIDQALVLFGMPQAVFADIAAQKGGAAPDYAHVLLRYEKLRVLLHISELTPVSDLRMAVHGSGGTFVKYGMDPQEEQSGMGFRPGQPGWGIDSRPGVFTPADALNIRRTVEAEPGDYRAFYRALHGALTDDAPLPVTSEEALNVMQIFDLALQSSRKRREISMG